MKTNIGGDRLGSGSKENVSLKNYERSTHDLSYTWRSSMSAGTLVPFMSQVGLPGDTFDIDLDCNVMTLPTIGPLFGSFKVQLDVFQIPMRLYNAQLHMNKLGIGMEMQNIKVPVIQVRGYKNNANANTYLDDNAQIGSSCILKYLGISGVGRLLNITTTNTSARRDFNAIPFLGYWDIYKNYYSNKQEEKGVVVHTDDTAVQANQTTTGAYAYGTGGYIGNVYNATVTITSPSTSTLAIQYPLTAEQPILSGVTVVIGGTSQAVTAAFNNITWVATATNYELRCSSPNVTTSTSWRVNTQTNVGNSPLNDIAPSLTEFPLSNIDDMRMDILRWANDTQAFSISRTSDMPYGAPLYRNGTAESNYYTSAIFSQEGLGIKTYQSDLFNNWISTEWIDGTGGISDVTKVSTSGNSFTIDSLNLAQKVYNMLNRIAISGGTYDDWLDAVYTHERTRGIESPMYLGSLIKELAFEEVIASTAAENQPLGQLAGRGRLTNKSKGGKIVARIDEPSYIMGIVSLTPRIDYSQGNSWDTNIESFNDLHKPALDAIGYQDLITDQMAWQDTTVTATTSGAGTVTKKSAGKQPAWLNYMTNVNKTFGNFAEENKEMFMTLNRKYNINESTGITDITTYIDPAKYNFIFADTNLDAQNFWVQIQNNITARRKMSAKIIPNL